MITKLILSTVCLVFLMTGSSTGNKEYDPIEVLRRPYLQSAMADSITVLWRTNEGSKAHVGLRKKGESEWKMIEGVTRRTNTGVIENEVTIRGLESNTSYHYQISTDDVPLLEQDSFYFRSPLGVTDTVFSFLAVGDIGEPVEEGGTPDLLGRALEPLKDSLQFGLLLGDLVYPHGKSENYDERLFQYFENVFPYFPVFTILGNHDWHEPEENYVHEWKLPGNEHYYSFDYGNAHFIGLDSKKGTLYQHEEQVSWLEKDLKSISDSTVWRVVFIHHNGKSCTYKGDTESVMSLYPLFEKYKVDLVLNGHAHTYERLNPMNGNGDVVSQVEGFTSITIGSGGKLRGVGTDPKPFVPNPDSCRHQGLVAAYAHKWAFLKLNITGKRLSAQAIGTEDLDLVDQFEIVK
ncbi:MAG: metallophosphoesterase family protein [Bacteroidota bacterium]